MTNQELAAIREVRNKDICRDYLTGGTVRQLSEKFDMSIDSIRRILRECLPEGAIREAAAKRATNICFDCARACGGCPWSARFEPVPGWAAEPVVIAYADGPRGTKRVPTYHITYCPLFERG